MKQIIYLRKIVPFLALMTCLLSGSAYAQTETGATMSGTVSDSFGKPLSGVVVLSEDGVSQVISNAKGEFNLELKEGVELVTFSLSGYKNFTMVYRGGAQTTVNLVSDISRADDIIDLGYTKATRNSITGAVSSISGKEMEKFPVANLSQKMTGSFTGLTVMEYNSELSRTSTWMMVRGISTTNGREPVVLIDGVICPNTNFDYITPEEIESITILKDGSSTALFGIQGANGVVVITTKRGRSSGPVEISATFDQSFQQMTKRPEYVNSARYAELRNEAGFNDGLGQYSQFSQSDIDNYRSGENRDLYPNNDYYNMFLKEYSTMQRAGVNIRGGNSKIKYFSNVNFMNQGLPYKISETQKYDPTPTNYWVNYRSNVDVKITPYLDGFMSLSGNIKREKTTGSSNSSVYSGLFNLPPTMYGPLSPVVVDPLDPTKTTGGQVITTDQESNPVYGMLNRSGYIKYIVTNIISQAGLTLDLGDIVTPGLKMTGLMSYQTNSVSSTYTTQDYERYVRGTNSAELDFVKKGTNNNTPLSYGKGSNFYYNLNFLGKVDYHFDRNQHTLDAMGYVYYLQQDKESWGSSAEMLNYKRQSLGVTATYGYDNRFYAKVDMGYSGSDQFHKDKRFTTTPAISGAWVVSNENFMDGAEWLTYLKLRASYGVSANDQLGYSQRFLYLDDFRSSNSYDGLRGNKNIEAEKMKKQNYGIDLGVFKDFLFSFDYFYEKCDNMLVSPTGMIPDYQGIPGYYYAKDNSGAMKNSGYEISATYTKQINSDWGVFANLGLSHTKNEILDINEAPNPNQKFPYRNTGYSVGQQWGYVINTSNGNGFFNSQAEIDNSGLIYSFGTPRPGDFIYKDLNGDNIIDSKDQSPIGNSWFPEYTYSLTAGGSYKNFDFSFMFYGVGKVSEMTSGVGFMENSNQGVYNDIHQNAWTAERYASGAKIDYPALSLGTSTSHQNNSYYIMDRSYIRLRNVEVGYTLPLTASKAISAKKIRFTLSGQNLFTFDNMKTDYVDPETGSLNRVQPYRVYSAGVNLVF